VTAEAEIVSAEAEIIMAEAEIIPLPPPSLPAFDGPVNNDKKSIIKVNPIVPPFRNMVIVVNGQTYLHT
jgi:hypothetical protein